MIYPRKDLEQEFLNALHLYRSLSDSAEAAKRAAIQHGIQSSIAAAKSTSDPKRAEALVKKATAESLAAHSNSQRVLASHSAETARLAIARAIATRTEHNAISLAYNDPLVEGGVWSALWALVRASNHATSKNLSSATHLIADKLVMESSQSFSWVNLQKEAEERQNVIAESKIWESEREMRALEALPPHAQVGLAMWLKSFRSNHLLEPSPRETVNITRRSRAVLFAICGLLLVALFISWQVWSLGGS